MAQKKLLANRNVFKRTDDRWSGMVWYMNEVESWISCQAGIAYITLQNSSISFFRSATASLYSTEHNPKCPQQAISKCP